MTAGGAHDKPDRHDNDVVVAIEAVCTSVRRSAAGKVVGANERASVLVGKMVLVGEIAPCGECEVCRRGGASVCPLAERNVFDDVRLTTSGRWLVALDDGLDLPMPAAAAVAGDVAVAYTLYARSGIAPRDPVVIVGASAVTRFVVEIIVAKGGAPAVIIDRDPPPGWHDWLLAKGVTILRDERSRAGALTGQTDVELRRVIAAAFAAQDVPAKPWCVITAADDAPRATGLAGPRARLTVLSHPPAAAAPMAPMAPLAIPSDVIAREVTVITVAQAHPDLVVEAAAMCVKREIDLEGGVTTGASDATRSPVSARPR